VTKEAPAAVRTVTVAPTNDADSTSEDSTPADATTAAEVTTTDEPTPEAQTTEQAPAATDPGSWTMPDMTGVGLQSAQDQMQALTGDPMFFTDSTDASGAGRAQVLDSNWQVCSQTPAPGTKITGDSRVSFAAVKLSESCP
jgi:cytoskeletal protein RodZ